ncbi:uncharacterized protein LOC121424113 [Lytechinus variegatus]|uniref:uncharacterized protein LOC121424113 n=1 Tax=Lytechinus variegatus TaxID=7654 RepID=UPI001BB1C856|nr:uncharacterized protein LOC121424113 [Lytechinus variegatus]
MEVPGSPFGSSSSPFGGGVSGRHRCKVPISSSRRPDGDMALQDMEGVLHNGMTSGSCGMARKRLRMDVDQENETEQLKRIIAVRGRNFIPISASNTTFHTEDVKQRSETIYLPLTDDVLVNMRSAEQISYGTGDYFIGDLRGNYTRKSQGYVVNLWRYSEANQKLFISRSFLFTNVMDFVQLKEVLENL